MSSRVSSPILIEGSTSAFSICDPESEVTIAGVNQPITKHSDQNGAQSLGLTNAFGCHGDGCGLVGIQGRCPFAVELSGRRADELLAPQKLPTVAKLWVRE